MFRKSLVLALMAIVLTGLVACAPAARQAPGSAAAAGPQEITVKGSEFKFDPNQITLKVGQPVRLVFMNIGTVDHELEIENLKAKDVRLDLSQAGKVPEDERDEAQGDARNGQVHAYAAAGGKAVVDFTPEQSGTFEFACNLPGHKEAGMVGKAIVQP